MHETYADVEILVQHAVASGQVAMDELLLRQVLHALRDLNAERDQLLVGRLVAFVADVREQIAVQHKRRDHHRQAVIFISERHTDQVKDMFVIKVFHKKRFFQEHVRVGRSGN